MEEKEGEDARAGMGEREMGREGDWLAKQFSFTNHRTSVRHEGASSARNKYSFLGMLGGESGRRFFCREELRGEGKG